MAVGKKGPSKARDARSPVSKPKAGFQAFSHLWMVGLFSVLLYANTIPNHYGFDDVYVTNNEEVKEGFAAIPRIFTSLYANLYEDGKDLTFGYRPVVKASFAIEYALFGDNPHLSHLINVLLYALMGMLLFRLLSRMFRGVRPWFVFFGVLLFLAHPTHTEVVASLKNRDEILSLLGALGGLYFVLNFSDGRGWWNVPLGMVVLMAAYLAKPTVLVFLAIYPLAMVLFTEFKWWRVVSVALLFTAAISFMAILPRTFLPFAHRPVQFIENPLYFERDLWVRVAAGLHILWFYLKLLVWPFPLRFYYGYDMIPQKGWGEISVWISFAIHLAMIVLALLGLKRRRILTFSILIYLITIFAFSNVFKPPMGIVADRFLFFPSIGFALGICYLVFYVFRADPERDRQSMGVRLPLGVLGGIILIFSVMTFGRNPDWDTPKTLFEADIAHLEKSAKANFIYAGTLRGEVLQALSKERAVTPELRTKIDLVFKHLHRATSVYGGYYQAWNMLGSSYLNFEGKPELAKSCFLKSVQAKDDYYPAYYNLGLVYSKLGNQDSARICLETALDVYPDTYQAHFKLMAIYQEQGDFEKAVIHGRKGREIKERVEEQKQRKFGLVKEDTGDFGKDQDEEEIP